MSDDWVQPRTIMATPTTKAHAEKSRPRINASNPAKLKTTAAIRITITARLLIGVRLCVPDNTYVADNIFLRNEIFYPVNCSKRTLRLAMDTYPYTAAVIMNALI